MDDWIIILLRSTSIFFIALIALRIMGKRQPVRMTPFHFLSYTVVGILAALISINLVANYVFGLIALGVWTVLFVALEYLALKSKWIHDTIYGRETILIKDGKVMEENLKEVRLTGEELLRELRSKNAFNLADVEFAVMESTGEVNVMLKSDKKPATPHDLEIQVAPQTPSQTVILDGTILDESLSNLGLNRNWLLTQLQSTGISVDNVFIGQADASGDLYLDLFDDFIEIPQPKVKEMLYANLEKIQADLTSFSLETQDPNAIEMYAKNAERLQKLNEILRPYLLR